MKIMYCFFFLLFLSVCFSSQHSDIVQASKANSSSSERKIYIGGDIGFSYQFYTVDGIDARNSPHTINFILDPYFYFYGLKLGMETTLDYYFDTNPQFILPSFNKLSFQPEWNWGGLKLFDYAPYFSELTLNGITLRGLSLKLTPGKFNLYVLGGNKKADSESPYIRRTYGLQIGYGGFNLNILQTTDIENNKAEIDTFYKPEQNGIVGISSDFDVLKANVKLELSASIYTRNMNSDKINLSPSIEWISPLFQPRITSYGDIAGSGKIKLNIPAGSISGKFKYIGPGYVSLGLISNKNDDMEFGFDIRSSPIRQIYFSGNYTQNRDNLIGNLVATTYYRNLSLSTTVSPVSFFTTSFIYLYYNTQKDADSDSDAVFLTTNMFTISPYVYYHIGKTGHSISGSYSHQKTDDENPISPYSSYVNFISANYSVQFSSKLYTSLGFSWNKSITGESSLHTTTYSLSANYNPFKTLLPIQTSITFSHSNCGNIFTAKVAPSLVFSQKDKIDFESKLNIMDDSPDSSSYKEFTASVKYIRSF